jgi:hypothetical protein
MPVGPPPKLPVGPPPALPVAAPPTSPVFVPKKSTVPLAFRYIDQTSTGDKDAIVFRSKTENEWFLYQTAFPFTHVTAFFSLGQITGNPTDGSLPATISGVGQAYGFSYTYTYNTQNPEAFARLDGFQCVKINVLNQKAALQQHFPFDGDVPSAIYGMSAIPHNTVTDIENCETNPILWKFSDGAYAITIDHPVFPSIFISISGQKWRARFLFRGKIVTGKVLSTSDFQNRLHAPFAIWLVGSVNSVLIYDKPNNDYYIYGYSRKSNSEQLWKIRGEVGPQNTGIYVAKLAYTSLSIENLEDIKETFTNALITANNVRGLYLIGKNSIYGPANSTMAFIKSRTGPISTTFLSGSSTFLINNVLFLVKKFLDVLDRKNANTMWSAQKKHPLTFLNHYKACCTLDRQTFDDLIDLFETQKTRVLDELVKDELVIDILTCKYHIPMFNILKTDNFAAWCYFRLLYKLLSSCISALKNATIFNCATLLKCIDLLNPEVVALPDEAKGLDLRAIEIATGFLCTKKQAKMLLSIKNGQGGDVAQLIMGAGKTSFITSHLMLSRFLDSAKTVVILPDNLVMQSAGVLRNILSKMVPNMNLKEWTNPKEDSYLFDSSRDYTSLSVHVIGQRTLQYMRHFKPDNFYVFERFWDKGVWFIFDEVDTLFNPMTNEFNVPDKESRIDTPDTLNVLVDFLIKCGTGDISNAKQTFGPVYSDVVVQAIKTGCQMLFKKDFGFGTELKDNPSNARMAIPYRSANTPADGSQFSDLELRVVLTFISYAEKCNPGEKRARLVDYNAVCAHIENNYSGVRSAIQGKGFNTFDETAVLGVMKRIFDKFDLSDASCREFMLSVWLGAFVRSPASQIEGFQKYSNAINDGSPFAVAQITSLLFRLAVNDCVKVFLEYKNIGMLEFARRDIIQGATMFSGTVSVHVNPLPEWTDAPIVRILPNEDDAQLIQAVISGVLCEPVTPTSTDVLKVKRLVSGGMGESRSDNAKNLATELLGFFCGEQGRVYDCLIDVAGILRTDTIETYVENIAARRNASVYFVDDGGNRMYYDVEDVIDHYKTYMDGSVVPVGAVILYMQKDTIGIDFKQQPKMRGLVTVCDDTTATELAQGAYRLRQLLYNHYIDLICCSIDLQMKLQTGEKRVEFFMQNEAKRFRSSRAKAFKQYMFAYCFSGKPHSLTNHLPCMEMTTATASMDVRALQISNEIAEITKAMNAVGKFDPKMVRRYGEFLRIAGEIKTSGDSEYMQYTETSRIVAKQNAQSTEGTMETLNSGEAMLRAGSISIMRSDYIALNVAKMMDVMAATQLFEGLRVKQGLQVYRQQMAGGTQTDMMSCSFVVLYLHDPVRALSSGFYVFTGDDYLTFVYLLQTINPDVRVTTFIKNLQPTNGLTQKEIEIAPAGSANLPPILDRLALKSFITPISPDDAKLIIGALQNTLLRPAIGVFLQTSVIEMISPLHSTVGNVPSKLIDPQYNRDKLCDQASGVAKVTIKRVTEIPKESKVAAKRKRP